MVRVPLAGRRVGGWVVGLGPPDAGRGRRAIAADGQGHRPGSAGRPGRPGRRGRRGVGRPAGCGPSCGRRRHRGGAGAARPGAIRRSPGAGRRRLRPACWPPAEGSLRRPPSATRSRSCWPRRRSVRRWSSMPAVDEARLLGARLRRAGLTVAVVPRDWAAAAGRGRCGDRGAGRRRGRRCRDWRAVVVLDEHDEALQEERVPTWHARDVVIERARRAGVPCLLVSPVPEPGRARLGRRPHRRLPSRNEERAGWPILEVVDRSHDEPWQQSLCPPAAPPPAGSGRRRGVRAERPGRARRLACRSCRALPRCERCQAAVDQPARACCAVPAAGRSGRSSAWPAGRRRWSALRPGVSAAGDSWRRRPGARPWR